MAEIDYGGIVKKNGKIIMSTRGIPEDLFGDERLKVELHRWGACFLYNNGGHKTTNWVANDKISVPQAHGFNRGLGTAYE